MNKQSFKVPGNGPKGQEEIKKYLFQKTDKNSVRKTRVCGI